MGIISICTDCTGQVDINPRRVKIITTDNLATVTAAGYLNNAALQGYTVLSTDMIDIWYSYVNPNNPGIFGQMVPSIVDGVITLVLWSNPGDVLLPVVSGDFALFNGTSGQIKDSGLSASASSQVYVATSPGSLTTNHLLATSDTHGTLSDSGIPLVNVIQTTVAANTQSITGNVLLNSNPVVVTKAVTAGFAALATAGKINVFVAPTVTAQIAILDIKVLYSSSGLSGGSGNRLLSLADGTLVFNNTGITAALLGTPIFTLWGGTGNPLPSSSEATVSTAGANVYLQYIGGTTDYTAGSVIVAVTYAQVTA